VSPGSTVTLDDIDPGFKGHHKDRHEAAKEVEQDRRRLRELQDLLFADKGQSILLCLQSLDTGGKDGTIEHVLGSMNPQGCKVVSFKQPTAEELKHDFLWRIRSATPGPGEVTIFNRSHYEDVLIARVHDLVPPEIWSQRYAQINEFEKELVDDNTQILKFYLHISKEEQLDRFKDRLDDPSKQWKISEADYKERAYWDDYTRAYEEALSRCSTKNAPWFIIPADRKWFRNLAIAKIVVEHLEGLKLTFPPPSVDIEDIRRKYHTAKKRSHHPEKVASST
jgi:PPK2 family polyphosphate:nucleotide phosphotransferase